jgi:hypothetical protein
LSQRSRASLLLSAAVFMACIDESAGPTAGPLRGDHEIREALHSARSETHDDIMAEIDSVAPGFAGVARDSAGRLMILLTKTGLDQASNIKRVAFERLRLSERGISDFERTAPANYSFRQLAGWRQQLVLAATRGDLASSDVHESSNKVVIESTSDAGKERLEGVAERIGIPLDAVTIRLARPRQPVLSIALDQIPGSPGGIVERIDGRPHCTLGYNVQVNGTWYYLTNSHCTGPIVSGNSYAGMGIVSALEAY